MHKPWIWLWPGKAGLAVPGFWAAFIACWALRGEFSSAPEALIALWPAVPLYLVSCALAAAERRQARPRLLGLVLAGIVLAAADLAVKAWLESRGTPQAPVTLVPGLLALRRTYNVYGTMLAIPGLKPFVTLLAIVMVPGSILSYRYYLAHERPVIWGDIALVGLFAGALGKAADLLWHGLIIDYLHIPGLPIADLADIYLLWVGAGCVLAATFCYPGAWDDVLGPLRKLRGLVGTEGTEGAEGSKGTEETEGTKGTEGTHRRTYGR